MRVGSGGVVVLYNVAGAPVVEHRLRSLRAAAVWKLVLEECY
jgi:hypothetical protein